IALTARYDAAAYPVIREIIARTKSQYAQPLYAVITMQRQEAANKISAVVFTTRGFRQARTMADKLSDLTMRPVTGIPILLLVLYYGLYQFVGVFGAGTLVDYLETEVFAALINPLVERLVVTYIPWDNLRSLVAGEYGIITLGFRYAIAIILPIVGTFFTAFSILEDTGYLPRLAMLVNGLFKHIGLNGRAVIPIVLGFGCDTMATMVSRTLETNRERIIATLLLALAIPCSAQLAVITNMLVPLGSKYVLAYVLVLFSVLGVAGTVLNRVLPGQPSDLFIDLPPLRWPQPENVLKKTYTKTYVFLREATPLFAAGALLMGILQVSGLLSLIQTFLAPLTVNWLQLPREAATAFIMGFIRRDFGAAGLYSLPLTPPQTLVALVTITLFVPCIASALVILKERGLRQAVTIWSSVLVLAFLLGGIISHILI
ncbi:MAG: ferrous iron transporter B, partial [Thermoanaerobacteraceae bacterium]|nr:ferrous iron transporter B [Thermoanaerobacteraceae bacterium]